MQLGPIRFAIEASAQSAKQPFENRLFPRETDFRLHGDTSTAPIQDLYRALAEDDQRYELLISDVLAALEEGRPPILLTERKDHLDHLARQLRPAAKNLVILKGGLGANIGRDTHICLRGKQARWRYERSVSAADVAALPDLSAGKRPSGRASRRQAAGGNSPLCAVAGPKPR